MNIRGTVAGATWRLRKQSRVTNFSDNEHEHEHD